MKELYQKIAKLKAEIGAISKDQENPFFKAKYFDINKLLFHVEPLLQKYELLLLQPIRAGVVMSLIIDPESGQETYSDIELPTIADPQKLGSAITYYRRYTLQSLLGLQAEDDDGNSASKADPKVKDDNKKVEWIAIGDKAWVKAVSMQMPLADLRKHYGVSKANAEQYLKEVTENPKS